MPHQCLNCGETFADGSTDLLKGCPGCEGTRFFFTQEPLDADERQELKQESQKNVHQMLKDLKEQADGGETGVEEMLRDLVQKHEKRNLDDEIWSRDAWERWIKLEQTDEGPQVSEVGDEELVLQPDKTPEEAPSPEPETPEAPKEALQVTLEDVEEVAPPEEGTSETLEVEAAPEARNQPSTLNILEPGNYEIDVERLMDDNPVIVERDGSYVIHLPSVFGKKGKR